MRTGILPYKSGPDLDHLTSVFGKIPVYITALLMVSWVSDRLESGSKVPYDKVFLSTFFYFHPSLIIVDRN